MSARISLLITHIQPVSIVENNNFWLYFVISNPPRFAICPIIHQCECIFCIYLYRYRILSLHSRLCVHTNCRQNKNRFAIVYLFRGGVVRISIISPRRVAVLLTSWPFGQQRRRRRHDQNDDFDLSPMCVTQLLPIHRLFSWGF